MKQERIRRRRFPLWDGRVLTVNYWLLTEEREERLWYGIAVTDSLGHSVRCSALSQSRWEVKRLIRTLARGCVTTVNAAEVVEDCLWERMARL